MTTKPRGGGVKALVVGPLKKELFFAASLMKYKILKINKLNFVLKLIFRMLSLFLNKL